MGDLTKKEIEDKIKKKYKEIDALARIRDKHQIRAIKGTKVSPGRGRSRRP
jgi:hypothetical protein|tara:strand:- start:120 stop:272 length:153 start_codon:yes stop_codon:yes gene_type:complete